MPNFMNIEYNLKRARKQNDKWSFRFQIGRRTISGFVTARLPQLAERRVKMRITRSIKEESGRLLSIENGSKDKGNPEPTA